MVVNSFMDMPLCLLVRDPSMYVLFINKVASRPLEVLATINFISLKYSMSQDTSF